MTIPFTTAQPKCTAIYNALVALQTAITNGSGVQDAYNALNFQLTLGVNALVPFVGHNGGGTQPDANELTGGTECDI